MALVVYFESMLRNQHNICNRRGAPVSSTCSRHFCARTVSGNCRRVENCLHSRISFVKSQHRAGRVFRVLCSSTADASREGYMALPTLYELLEIPQHVGLPEIKVAYRQMARRYHPDVCSPTEKEECTRRFLQVQEAYDTLSDPHLRADYDFWLQNPLNARTLSAGFRAGNRRRTGKSDMDLNADWKEQWESQLQGLRNRRDRGGKQESWATRMRSSRDESSTSSGSSSSSSSS